MSFHESKNTIYRPQKSGKYQKLKDLRDNRTQDFRLYLKIYTKTKSYSSITAKVFGALAYAELSITLRYNDLIKEGQENEEDFLSKDKEF